MEFGTYSPYLQTMAANLGVPNVTRDLQGNTRAANLRPDGENCGVTWGPFKWPKING